MRKYISASLLAADKTALKEELKRVNDSQIDFVHFDVMDNVFVPNTSFNDDTFSHIREYSPLPFEVHLMVENPFDYINKYGDNPLDVIIVHYESFASEEDLMKCLLEIKKHHKVGLSLKPATKAEALDKFLPLLDYLLVMSVEPGFGGQKFMESSLDKIAYFDKKKKENNYHYLIEVDGGINDKTGELCFAHGVDIVVSGSYLFKGDMKENARKLR